jgi:hypothetical protein
MTSWKISHSQCSSAICAVCIFGSYLGLCCAVVYGISYAMGSPLLDGILLIYGIMCSICGAFLTACVYCCCLRRAHIDELHIDKPHIDKPHIDKPHIDKPHVDKP